MCVFPGWRSYHNIQPINLVVFIFSHIWTYGNTSNLCQSEFLSSLFWLRERDKEREREQQQTDNLGRSRLESERWLSSGLILILLQETLHLLPWPLSFLTCSGTRVQVSFLWLPTLTLQFLPCSDLKAPFPGPEQSHSLQILS